MVNIFKRKRVKLRETFNPSGEAVDYAEYHDYQVYTDHRIEWLDCKFKIHNLLFAITDTALIVIALLLLLKR